MTPSDTSNTNTRSTSRRRLFVAGAAVALVACSALSACDVDGGGTRHPPRNDVNPGWTCNVERGRVRSNGTITNQSSKTSFYVIDVEFRLDGRVVDHSTAGIDDVDPGETARVETSSSDVVDSDVTCHVASVDRFEA